ncbi:glycosyltransferase [Sphingobium sp. AN641]|uniref:glycosyltransferase n=1 Tax=Sphingobium sp. AN641 TaxID=3133443 RepID=UPI0030BED52F
MLAAMTLWLLMQGLTLIGVGNYLANLPRDRKQEPADGVVVILSVRDDWDGSPDLIARLERQDVAGFRLLVATSGECPAALALASREPGRVQLVAAGRAADEGQKVHKLRAALRALHPDDRYLVFIDADIAPPARLIGRLLFPLVRDKADIVTGYRLLLPARGRPALALVGAVEMQLATLPRFPSATMPWGGAMAMRRETADRLGLDAALAGRLSDDMAIGLAAWRAKLRLRPVRDLLVASPLDERTGAALAFAVRQYRHIATNSMGMWALATAVAALQSAGWLWALGWGGWPAIGIGYGAAWGRMLLRRRIIAGVVEPEQAIAARRSLAWDVVAPFAICWMHLAIQLVAVSSSTIRWGGYDYRVQRGRVTRMARVDQNPAGN